MLCRTESMQPALVSSTGVSVQWGMTCGETFTDGFDGGTMPDRARRYRRGGDRRPARIPARRRRRARRAAANSTRRARRIGAVSPSVRPLVPGNGSAGATYHFACSGPRGCRVNCRLIAGGREAQPRCTRSALAHCRTRHRSPCRWAPRAPVVRALCRLGPVGSISIRKALSAS